MTAYLQFFFKLFANIFTIQQVFFYLQLVFTFLFVLFFIQFHEIFIKILHFNTTFAHKT